jgi:hypothetical protein
VLHLVQPDRNCSPETVGLMTAAFDSQLVCRCAKADEDVRRSLARIILRHVDQGTATLTAADAALREWTGDGRAGSCARGCESAGARHLHRRLRLAVHAGDAGEVAS